MKKEFEMGDMKFIYSQNEFGFQEIIDDMAYAKKITIVTYNISEKRDNLIECLKKAAIKTCEITIITNIPSRWEQYYNDTVKSNSKNRIKVYLEKLEPEKIGNKVDIFFNFSNHCKIIMKDNIIYIGSQNYSDESKENNELGFIYKDKEFIKFINEEVICELIENSCGYYYENSKAQELLLEANMLIYRILDLKNNLCEKIYTFYDDVRCKSYYYNITEIIDHSLSIVDELCCELCDDIDLTINYNNLLKLSKEIEDLIYSEEIYKMISFDESKNVEILLQENYGSEAYDENLQKCIDLAYDETQEKTEEITGKAKKKLDKLIYNIEQFQYIYTKYIEKIQKNISKRINPKIDNTI